MMSKLLQSVALAASMVVATSAVQAQELKIGYVNSEAVLRESNLAKLAQAKLEAEFGKREKDLKDQESKLRAAAEKLEKDAPTLSEAERGRRSRDIGALCLLSCGDAYHAAHHARARAARHAPPGRTDLAHLVMRVGARLGAISLPHAHAE